MESRWQHVTIASVSEKIGIGPFGSSIPVRSFVSEGVPVISGQHLRGSRLEDKDFNFVSPEHADRLASASVKRGDVIFTHAGSIGQVAYIPGNSQYEHYVLSQRQFYLRPNKSLVLPEYVVYYFKSPVGRHLLLANASSSGVPSIVQPVSYLRTIRIPLPSLPEQHAMVRVLGALDDKIELNRRMNETLEAMARALFTSWFIDFDPVHAKAEGRDPGLPIEIAALFPDAFQDSELGEIPKGWDVKRLADLCSTQYGYTASAVNEPVGPKYLRVTDINKRNWIRWSDVPYCAIDADARHVYALHVGDLIVARMADPGKSAIIEEEIDAVFASYLVRLKTASLAQSYYIYGFLKSDLYTEYAKGAKSGSVQANMNAKVIVDVGCVVPPPALIQRYVNAVLPLRWRLVASSHESHTLATLRDMLLPMLMSGELRVPANQQV
jgi:type I restriction enzyme S subunit